MNYFKFILIALVALTALSCSSTYSVVEDDEGPIIIGQLTWEQWQEHAGWEKYFPKDYMPKKLFVEDITSYTNFYGLHYIIFAGNWCHDTEVALPKIYKLLTMAGVFDRDIQLIGLDLDKQEPTGFADEFDIERVPTLIVMSGDKEIGRIVETPKKSWDKDLVEIIRDFVFEESGQQTGGFDDEPSDEETEEDENK
jgi:hypothetical protein